MSFLAKMTKNAQKGQKNDQKLLFLVIQICFDGDGELWYFGGRTMRENKLGGNI